MGQWGIINTFFLSFSCLNNEIMHVKKSAIFLRKVLYFDQMCYKSAIINPKSAINAIYLFKKIARFAHKFVFYKLLIQGYLYLI